MLEIIHGSTTDGLILFCPDNKPGRKDGDEFCREAKRFNGYCGGQRKLTHIIPLTGTQAERQDRFQDIEPRNYDFVAYFGHGLKSSLVKFYSSKTIEPFANHLIEICNREPTIILYACNAGEVFAKDLYSMMSSCGLNPTVYGHIGNGHTTMNPRVIMYNAVEPEGEWLVDPKSALWKVWKESLRPSPKVYGEMRFRFPFLYQHCLLEELEELTA